MLFKVMFRFVVVDRMVVCSFFFLGIIFVIRFLRLGRVVMIEEFRIGYWVIFIS